MPTKEQQKTISYYGINGDLVSPFEELYFYEIEDVLKKIDEIDHCEVKTFFEELCFSLENTPFIRCLDKKVHSSMIKRRQELSACVKKDNFYETLLTLFEGKLK